MTELTGTESKEEEEEEEEEFRLREERKGDARGPPDRHGRSRKLGCTE